MFKVWFHAAKRKKCRKLGCSETFTSFLDIGMGPIIIYLFRCTQDSKKVLQSTLHSLWPKGHGSTLGNSLSLLAGLRHLCASTLHQPPHMQVLCELGTPLFSLHCTLTYLSKVNTNHSQSKQTNRYKYAEMHTHVKKLRVCFRWTKWTKAHVFIDF